MASPSRSRPSSDAYRLQARILGVVSSAVALALAALAALAINDLAHHDVTGGIALLMALLALRWLANATLHEWDEGVASRLRVAWRRSVVTYMAMPRREGERGRGDLSLAIERAANAPALERLGASALSALLGLVVIFLAAGWLPLVITVVLLAAAAPLYQRAGRRSARMADAYHERRALLETRQLEILQRAPELRALGAVSFGAKEIGAISASEHTLALSAVRVALESSLVTEFLSGVSVGLVAMVVGFGLLDGRLSLLRALVAVLVTSELFTQVRRFGVEFHRRDDAQSAMALLEPPPSPAIVDSSAALLSARALVTEANRAAVTLSVVPGDRVVVRGPSGVGKTTLLHSLLGWRAPREGTVQRSGDAVGYVSAESALVSGTLRDNLALGVNLDDRALFAILGELGLVGERFSDLDIELLSDGRGMSSGERVRVALARALLATPTLLFVDDIAGVLDEEARNHVRQTLAARNGLALVEATVDASLVEAISQRIELQ